MSLSRRKMLALVGGGTVLAAGGMGCVLTRAPNRALAPWAEAGSHAERRMNALSFAILAPNPHNRQPWKVELVGDDAVRVFRDPALNLPQTDPYDRQMTIGMGCFLELLVIAASATGHAVDLDLFPKGEAPALPVAVARFRADAADPDPLGAAILDRRSCREPFADRPVSQDSARALASLAAIITDPARVAEIRALTLAAYDVEATTPRVHRESAELMRFGRDEIEAAPDGIALRGPLLEGLMLVGMLTRDGQLDPASAEFRQGIERQHRVMSATPAYAVITTAGNSRTNQIEAGRRYVRLNLATTELGLALHPVSQALEEYPEMSGHYAMAHRLFAGPGETVQMLARLGTGPGVPPSPRWPLHSRLRQA